MIDTTESRPAEWAGLPAVHNTSARSWRLLISRVLLVALALLAPLALVAGWARLTLLDTDTYVERVASLASDEGFQQMTTNRVVASLAEKPRVAEMLASGSLTMNQLERAVGFVVASDAFGVVWTSANRLAHPQLVAVLTGDTDDARMVTAGGRVILNMNPLVKAVEDRLNLDGYQVDLGLAIADWPLTITIFESEELEDVQHWVKAFDRVAIMLPFAAAAAAVGAVLASDQRRKAIRATGVAVAGGMALTVVLMLLGRWLYLDSLRPDVPVDAAAPVFDVLTASLWQSAAVLIIAGAGIALLFGWLARKSEAPT
jgi:hypothetical protein